MIGNKERFIKVESSSSSSQQAGSVIKATSKVNGITVFTKKGVSALEGDDKPRFSSSLASYPCVVRGGIIIAS